VKSRVPVLSRKLTDGAPPGWGSGGGEGKNDKGKRDAEKKFLEPLGTVRREIFAQKYAMLEDAPFWGAPQARKKERRGQREAGPVAVISLPRERSAAAFEKKKGFWRASATGAILFLNVRTLIS